MRVVKIVVVNLILTLVLLEVGAFLISLVQGRGGYTVSGLEKAEAVALLPDSKSPDFAAPDANDFNSERRLHPYFGYTYDPRRSGGKNNHGFSDSVSLPYRAEDGEFVVGVLGGSFAQQFGRAQPRRALAAGMLELVKDQGYRSVRIVNLAQGGHKQPQPLFTLLYFIDSLDAAILVDGFNEIMSLPDSSMVPESGLPYDFPKATVYGLLASASSEEERVLFRYKLDQLREQQARLTAQLSGAPWRYSMFAHQIWRYRFDRLNREATRLLIAAEENQREEVFPLIERAELTNEEVSREFFRRYSIWLESAWLTMKSQDKLFFHFVQPNQYFENSKIITAKERQIALRYKEGDTGRGVTAHYPDLIEMSARLREKGIPSFNTTMALKDNDETLYIDSCCHLNPRGMTVMAETVLGIIAESDEFARLKVRAARATKELGKTSPSPLDSIASPRAQPGT